MSKKIRLGVLSVENEAYFPYGKQIFFYEDMLRAYPAAPFEVFFFSPLDWKDGPQTVKGYQFKSGQWQAVTAEIPRLLYDRAFSKDAAEKLQLEKCRAKLLQAQHHFLNPLALVDLLNNKVDFHQFLQNQGIPTLAAYEFAHLPNQSVFETLATPRIYLKPTFGSKGEGIFVLEKTQDQYLIFDHLGEKTTYTSYTKFWKQVTQLIDHPSRYFVQAEAQIVRYQDAPFDVRVVVQNRCGTYKITGLGARIGQQHSMTSNLNAGGAALPLDELAAFFQAAYGTDAATQRERMEQICLQCSQRIAAQYGEFLEIGFDILCTRDQGPIIIEGNAKPSRWIFNVISDYLIAKGESGQQYTDLREASVRVPMEYAAYLLET
ncbi:MAG: YheC/YheD family protein [Saprospiraceae bacterium]